ncbi:hypothetical protein Btru_062260 [Bulinus truncatus]|nr:hypothetical protein Btru_062260 [Bulinus truncatus]
MFSLYFLLTVSVFFYQDSDASICGKFNVGGPCAYLPVTTTTTTTPSPYFGIDTDYCRLACSQDQETVFGSLCSCGENCYYTRNRPAKLSTFVKRMYSGTPTVTECDYPGVVGIYNATSQKFMCMGVLLEESKIMVDTFCKNMVGVTLSYASLESYTKPQDFTGLPTVLASTATLLDPTKSNTKVYTVSLSKPVVFNDACVQPACFPNTNLPLADVDLNDCRIVGYGDTNNTFGTASSVLLEVLVKVDPNSVTKGVLQYTRVDGKSSRTGPCFNDQGGPLICNHKVTNEWVTIGVVTSIGLKCTEGLSTVPAIASLLTESTNHNLYNGLQSFKYVNVS